MSGFYNAGPYSADHFPLPESDFRPTWPQWELSYRWACVPASLSTLQRAGFRAASPSSDLSLRQGSSSDAMPLGISGPFQLHAVFQAEHNIPDAPFSRCSCDRVFWRSLFSPCTVRLVNQFVVRDTTGKREPNYGYKFGNQEENLHIVAAHGYLRPR